jgi:hypothetical protein
MPISPELASKRGRFAALARTVKTGERKPNDPKYVAAQQALKAANLEKHIKTVVDSAPPLTEEQRTKLAELLKPVRGSGAVSA